MVDKRHAFLKRIGRVNPKKLVFIDEAGANIRMRRSHAWIVRGKEPVEPRPMNRGDNVTMLGAVRWTGFITMETMRSAANRERFSTWLRRRLLPKLRRGDVLVMDNAQAHHGPNIRPLCRKYGVRVEYLPPYSPDFNPIEPAWGLVKKTMRGLAPTNHRHLRVVAHRARRRVRPLHCQRWFEHAGYRCLRK